jgi:hypothetical protein
MAWRRGALGVESMQRFVTFEPQRTDPTVG